MKLLLATLFGGVLLVGCAGGAEGPDLDKTAVSNDGTRIIPSTSTSGDSTDNSRYLALALKILEPLETGTPTSAEEGKLKGEALIEASRLWSDLEPPEALRGVHEEYGDFLANAGELLVDVAAGRADESDVSRVRGDGGWQSAVEELFSVKLIFIEGGSLEPTFCDGNGVVFKESDGIVDRWQTILFDFPLDPSRGFVKRVVGLPGETIEVRDGTVLVNGTPVDGDTYAQTPANYAFGPNTAPPDSYFVLGDSRNNSYDSHAWGSATGNPDDAFVPSEFIRGEIDKDERGSC